MTKSPSSTAQRASEALGQRLRTIRQEARITARALAEQAGWHETKCSHLQSGLRSPTEEDIRTWTRICGADNQAEDLIATARNIEGMYVEWRRLQSAGLTRLQHRRVPLYEQTRAFKIYCSNFMPGFLQDPNYITALFMLFTQFHGSVNDVESAVAARVERSKILRHGDHTFAILVEESVLRYRIGGSETLLLQLTHLLRTMTLPSVVLGVIPETADRTMWPVESFTMFDDRTVSVELLGAQVTVTAPSDVDIYVRAFTTLSEMAVYDKPARSLITAAIDSLG
ncbi:helix-turn-helix transcriptional regulator [Catenulispora yoronensis]|uniref:Helix-turn-helix transcriptional regulator n=1 Tax=Catenulispora yoronensis TaxID=450799 RepID=A0ABP5F9F2_9ACTN